MTTYDHWVEQAENLEAGHRSAEAAGLWEHRRRSQSVGQLNGRRDRRGRRKSTW
jgi:hypothetical protein